MGNCVPYSLIQITTDPSGAVWHVPGNAAWKWHVPSLAELEKELTFLSLGGFAATIQKLDGSYQSWLNAIPEYKPGAAGPDYGPKLDTLTTSVAQNTAAIAALGTKIDGLSVQIANLAAQVASLPGSDPNLVAKIVTAAEGLQRRTHLDSVPGYLKVD